jgi:hypothetical protein
MVLTMIAPLSQCIPRIHSSPTIKLDSMGLFGADSAENPPANAADIHWFDQAGRWLTVVVGGLP